MKKGYLIILLMAFSGYLFAQPGNFDTSLHKTRNGKAYWYNADTSITKAPKPGFQTFTNIAVDTLGCIQCHGATDATGNPYPPEYSQGTCVDCHNGDPAAGNVVESQCFSCHGRQGAEVSMGFGDVHRDADTPMQCWDCHGTTDMHGDGTEYSSFLEDGAIAADCEDCHFEGNEEGAPVYDHVDSDPHDGALHCTACHTETVISCYNCHFNSKVEGHVKRANTKIKNFVILANRDKDDKVGTMSFQSLTYDLPGGGDSTWVAFAPYTGHTTMKAGRTCDDCHANTHISDYMENGEIKFATWNAADTVLETLTGVVPFPYDFETSFKMDFITYTGDLHAPAGPSKEWKSIGEDTWDGYQLFFASALTEHQIEMLSLDFGTIWENFSVSQHKTRSGKGHWYNEPDGFESLTHVAIDSAKMGCVDCHDKKGGLDANGDPYPEDYEAGCYDCHGSTTNGDPAAFQARCLACHGRQGAEAKMGFVNAHQDTSNHDVPYLYCQDCHMNDGESEYYLATAPIFDDIHGHDATAYPSMLSDGAMQASCENCHDASGHASKGTHDGKVSCEACHAQTVISCYNCHLNSQLEGNKRAQTKIKNFMMLANRTKSGDVYPMSFQSLTFDNDAGGHDTWVAFGPYTPHSITKDGRACADCHNNYGGTNPAIIDYNEDGIMTFAEWDESDSTVKNHTGVVPMPVDYLTKFKMDFITYMGETTDPVVASKNWVSVDKDTWDGQQMYFATPLDTNQMKALGMETKYVSVSDEYVLLPTKYNLKQNYPNPFNPSTMIEFDLPYSTEVTLVVFNILGKEVTKLYNKEMIRAGNHKISFDASKLASGIYFYQLRTKDFVKTRKMSMLK